MHHPPSRNTLSRQVRFTHPTCMTDTPAQLGYRWPAEWEPQASVWLSWPRNPGDLARPLRAGARRVRAVRAAARRVRAGEYSGRRRASDGAGAGRSSATCRTSRCTTSPPTTPGAAITGRRFCSLQSLGVSGQSRSDLIAILQPAEPVDCSTPPSVPPWSIGNTTPGAASIRRSISTTRCRGGSPKLQGRRVFSPGIILEGGAIDGNGRGTILTTESCLLNPNRNPQLSREAGRRLSARLSGREESPLADRRRDRRRRHRRPHRPDRPVRESDDGGRVRCATTGRRELRPDAAELRRASAMTDQDGRPLDVIPLRLPRPLFCDGQRLPAGYCNFLIANGVVIVPQFGDPADDEALRTLAAALSRPRCPRQPVAQPDLGARLVPLPLAAGTGVNSADFET